LFRGTYELRLHADNVGGLKPRSAVLLAGVQVGSVSNIKLAEDGKSVTIFLRIYQNYKNKIYHDERFVIEQSGFLGDQYVSIIPTANQLPLLQDGADVPCEQPFNLQEVARSASGFILRIDETAKKLDTTVSDVNAFIATNGSQIDLAVSNAVFLSQELARLASSARNVISTNSEGISASVKNIESSTEVLKKLMDDLQSGKGLAGTMLKNEQLVTNVQEIADNLAIATGNLDRLGLWHFLWHREPPHTNEMTQKP
jgi:phospholipid/cholesterol/gamma-HCH transport system substrate-binding protein